MWTMTGVVSLASPLKDGFVLLDGVVIELSDTPGEAVLTVNLMVLLTPCGLPRELAWVATAWYWPLEREGLAPPEFQPPGALVASALETSVFEELKMWTTTAVVSLASPLKDGVVLFDGEGIESSVTLGEAVLTVNLMVLLASPLKDGFVLLDGEEMELSVTVGEVVSTVNLMLLLAPPGFPTELAC